MSATYTHVGSRREVGRVHSGKVYGHRDYDGKGHALTGPSKPYDGAVYAALCGKKVVAEFDDGFNVSPIGGLVTCKRCRQIIGGR